MPVTFDFTAVATMPAELVAQPEVQVKASLRSLEENETRTPGATLPPALPIPSLTTSERPLVWEKFAMIAEGLADSALVLVGLGWAESALNVTLAAANVTPPPVVSAAVQRSVPAALVVTVPVTCPPASVTWLLPV